MNKNGLKVVVFGGTGTVGKGVVQGLLENPGISKILLISRTTLTPEDLPTFPDVKNILDFNKKIIQKIVNFKAEEIIKALTEDKYQVAFYSLSASVRRVSKIIRHKIILLFIYYLY